MLVAQSLHVGIVSTRDNECTIYKYKVVFFPANIQFRYFLRKKHLARLWNVIERKVCRLSTRSGYNA